MKHNGSFDTPEGGYGGEFTLEDGTIVNVVTIFTGPGLAADTEIEAERPLTTEEQNDVMDEDAGINHAKAGRTPYVQRPVQHRI